VIVPVTEKSIVSWPAFASAAAIASRNEQSLPPGVVQSAAVGPESPLSSTVKVMGTAPAGDSRLPEMIDTPEAARAPAEVMAAPRRIRRAAARRCSRFVPPAVIEKF
jgi:hypothetical protein